MEPIRIFIGYDQREEIAYHVLCASIMRRASAPIQMIFSFLAPAG